MSGYDKVPVCSCPCHKHPFPETRIPGAVWEGHPLTPDGTPQAGLCIATYGHEGKPNLSYPYCLACAIAQLHTLARLMKRTLPCIAVRNAVNQLIQETKQPPK